MVMLQQTHFVSRRGHVILSYQLYLAFPMMKWLFVIVQQRGQLLAQEQRLL